MINRIKIAMVIFGLLLVAMIGGILWMNYTAQMALRRSVSSRFLHDTQRLAVNLEYFFTERKDDLKDLTQSRELSVFFENQALGMSMAYGLKASLLGIVRKLEDVLDNKRFNDDPIYARLFFIDKSGKMLVDIPPNDNPTEKRAFFPAPPTPDSAVIDVYSRHNKADIEVILSAGYFFKGRYAGQLVAVLSKHIIFDHFLEAESAPSHRHLGLLCKDGYFHDGTAVSWSFPIPPSDSSANNLIYLYPHMLSSEAAKPIIQETSLAVRTPVPKTPFSIVVLTPVSVLFNNTSPWALPSIMGILTAVIIVGIATLWRLNTKNTILHTRLEETAKREQAIKKYQENLERLVEERTRDLKAAQSRLINKAMEAGRVQLSAMVLHNIGNALTPIGVFMSGFRKNDLRQSLSYLSQCYVELKRHQDDLSAFLARDERGKEIFAFMEQLIDDLQQAYANNRQTEKKVAEAMDYISEIITMQQAYAASEHEVKRRVDLNALVDDAIRMQAGALEKRDIQVHKSLEPTLPPLIIDKNRLMQVLVNIIKNGYEAIDQSNSQARKKRMIFRTFVDHTSIGVSISDTGVGVDPQNLLRLFDLGHSGKGSSGFGLYYCKMFVEANQGDMTIESEGVGCGTTVSIRFEKLVQSQPEQPQAPSPTPSPLMENNHENQ